jgi:NAD(P)-dependent dehydrogenase (short-subunit alcohol dehydrogenase family)
VLAAAINSTVVVGENPTVGSTCDGRQRQGHVAVRPGGRAGHAPGQRTAGRIVNVSSDTIWMGVPMLLHYVASKGAIFALTRALARELSGTGIT